MKKKIFIVLGILGAMIAGVFIILQMNKENEQPQGFSESCWEEVEDYTITETENGTFSVELTAPDYKDLLGKITENNAETVVTEEMLMNLTQKNEAVLKNYTFSVETDDIEAIKEGYFNEIGNDICELIMETYTEGYGAEGQSDEKMD